MNGESSRRAEIRHQLLGIKFGSSGKVGPTEWNGRPWPGLEAKRPAQEGDFVLDNWQIGDQQMDLDRAVDHVYSEYVVWEVMER